MRWFLPVVFLFAFMPALNIAQGADLNALRLLVPLFAFAWLGMGLVRGSVVLPVTPAVLGIAALTAVAGISVLWAAEPAFAARKALFLLSLLPLVVIVASRSPAGRRLFLETLAAGAALSALVGVATFIAQFVVGHDAVVQGIVATFAPRLWGESAAQAVARFSSFSVDVGNGRTLLRAFFPFPDPHTAALFWGMGLPVAAATANAKRTARRAQWVAVAAFTAAALVLFLAVLLSFSRGAYVALLALGAAYAIRQSAYGNQRRVAAAIGGILFATVLFAATVGQPIVRRFVSAFDLREGSNAERLALWRETLEVAGAHPVLGVGVGNLAQQLDPRASYRTPTNAHSTYLELFAELGVVGLGLFVFTLTCALLPVARRMRHDAFSAGIAGALLFYAVYAVFETHLYHPANVAALLALLTVAGSPERAGARRARTRE